ncbi:MAG: ATP-dependent DNA helicase [Candidatus Heimdallarchaeota archaeon]|nr:ATP-dependent DNA helicase [Candidatus Heimdallarchaeota archaeon]
MKIDHSTKELKISIRELAQISVSNNSEGERSIGLSNRIRTAIGRDVHKEYQDKIQKTKMNAQPEYHVKYTVKSHGWTVLLNGRADVVYEENDKLIIEEIKSTTETFNPKQGIRQDYVRQLQLYAHGFLRNKKKVSCNMVIYDILNNRYHNIPVKVENQIKFIDKQVKLIIDLHKQIRKNSGISKNRFETLKFPFDNFRRNQEKLINLTNEALEGERSILISAPSGMGKTIGTLYPSIKFALKNSLRVFIATSKTTQQRIYEDTLKIMTKKKGKFNSIILTAKEKICNNVEFNCDPSVCPYLENYINGNTTKSVERLLTKNVLNSRIIKREANNTQVCAFELSLDASLECDIIVGDYNYIFHPQIRLRRFFDSPYKDSIVIIDEAHNLSQRAIEYYSPSISQGDIIDTRKSLSMSKLPMKLTRRGIYTLKEIAKYIASFEKLVDKDAKWKTLIVEINKNKTKGFQKHLDFFILEYIREFTTKHNEIPSPKDPIIAFAEKLNYFNSILKESSTPEFAQLYLSEEKSMKILCISAARKLSKQIKGFHSAIAQSATLFPLEYFQKMLGFPKDSHQEEFGSTFPKENQLRMTYPLVSTKYHDRLHYDEDIANLISKSIEHKKGNYLVFFPSFTYLKSVHDKLKKQPLDARLLIQEPNMNDRKRRYFLKKLQDEKQNHLLLGVHGGIFSEGVDYTGDMAIGVFIIGPGLPAYTFEQELRKKYFQDKWKKGFKYAYRNPGMNKVIQSAGRIFRSETDKGFVMLIGQRFETSFYSEVLPKDWEIVSQKHPGEIIQEFWGGDHKFEIPNVTSLESLLN